MTSAALEVWGDPIAHSRSPALHAAAYRVLGLDWTYGRRRVSEPRFPAVLAWARDERMRGLSLTFPLKEQAFASAVATDAAARRTGSVNTLLLADDGPHGANTDVAGLAAALLEAGYEGGPARIVGGGATARSALAALAALDVGIVEVVARRPDAARDSLAPLATDLDVQTVYRPLGGSLPPVPLTIATLPGGSDIPDAVADGLAEGGGVLYDVVYGHWPTALAAAWQRAGLPAHDGRAMLLHQAVRQVRLFVHGDAERPLECEADVVAAMREALVKD